MIHQILLYFVTLFKIADRVTLVFRNRGRPPSSAASQSGSLNDQMLLRPFLRPLSAPGEADNKETPPLLLLSLQIHLLMHEQQGLALVAVSQDGMLTYWPLLRTRDCEIILKKPFHQAETQKHKHPLPTMMDRAAPTQFEWRLLI